MSTRPQPKCVSHPGCAGSGVPVPPVFPGVTSSAVCSRISRVSSARRLVPASRAALTTSAAAPEALPVLTDPVGPSIEIELLPPNWVVFAPRKKVPGGMFEPKAGSCPWMKSQTGCPLLQSIPSPTLSGTVPWISIARPYAAG